MRSGELNGGWVEAGDVEQWRGCLVDDLALLLLLRLVDQVEVLAALEDPLLNAPARKATTAGDVDGRTDGWRDREAQD